MTSGIACLMAGMEQPPKRKRGRPLSERLRDVQAACDRGYLILSSSPGEGAAMIDELVAALRLLHDNLAEYQRINNLGGYDNHDMRMARAAISKAEGLPHA